MTSYLYEDRDHPERVTRVVTASTWSDEDRALMLAYRIWDASLCPGCRQPQRLAWHPDMNGWYQVDLVECQACTAIDVEEHPSADQHKPRTYPLVTDTRDYAARPLPPLTLPGQA